MPAIPAQFLTRGIFTLCGYGSNRLLISSHVRDMSLQASPDVDGRPWTSIEIFDAVFKKIERNFTVPFFFLLVVYPVLIRVFNHRYLGLNRKCFCIFFSFLFSF